MSSHAYHACVLSCFNCIRLCATLRTIARQAPVHGILQARILEWVACPSPGDLPHPGTKAAPLMCLASAGGFFTISASWEAGSESCLCVMEHYMSPGTRWVDTNQLN